MTANLLTPAQVAEWLGVSENTLQAWRSRKQGPPSMKVERLVRYDPKLVQDWLRKSGGNDE